MSLIIRERNKLFLEGNLLKNLPSKDFSSYIVMFRNDKANMFFSEGRTWLYFMDSIESAEKMRNGEYEMIMFPVRHRFDFNSNPITDIWKKKHTTKSKGSEHVLAVFDGTTSEEEIYVHMISIRPGYKKNSISKKMMDLLRMNYPNAKISVSGVSEEGRKFFSKYCNVNESVFFKDGEQDSTEFDCNLNLIKSKPETAKLIIVEK